MDDQTTLSAVAPVDNNLAPPANPLADNAAFQAYSTTGHPFVAGQLGALYYVILLAAVFLPGLMATFLVQVYFLAIPGLIIFLVLESFGISIAHSRLIINGSELTTTGLLKNTTINLSRLKQLNLISMSGRNGRASFLMISDLDGHETSLGVLGI